MGLDLTSVLIPMREGKFFGRLRRCDNSLRQFARPFHFVFIVMRYALAMFL
jgi:hypothetical protein